MSAADKLAESLRELLDVQDLEKKANALHFAGPLSSEGENWKPVYETLRRDYIRRQPLAWGAAREALAEWESGKAQPSVPANVMQDMIDIGTGKLKHDYQGLCPDELEGHDLRDPACRACRALSLAAPTSPQAAEQAGEPVAWQVKSKENGSWGPPITKKRTADELAAGGHEVRALYAGSPPAGAVPAGWPEAYAAFQGAFDTPLARRHDNSEFAKDARRRLREFNEALLGQESQASHPPVQPTGGE